MKEKTKGTPDADAAAQTRRVTWAGVFVNIALSAAKFAAGVVGHSQALIADAVHSLSDLVTDFAVLFGLPFWSAPADDDHPYGHQRIETLVTMVIGGALLLVGGGIGFNAVSSLRQPHLEAPGKIALVGALLSIILKEWLYRWTVAVGRRINSSAVIANAWHHRSDALSSIPALLAVGVAVLNPKLAIADHVGAFIVSLFILKVAWNIMSPSLSELADRAASEKDRNEIRAIATLTPGVKSVHALRSRRTGSGIRVDLHVLVDGQMTVKAGHDIAEAVKRAIMRKGPHVLDVVVHLEPEEDGIEPA